MRSIERWRLNARLAGPARHVLGSFLLVGLLSGGCSLDNFGELEQRCRKEARVLVHDPDLWRDYLAAANQAYAERLSRAPDTQRVVAEYAPGFDDRYGADLRDLPETVDGAVTRQDLFVVKDGEPIVQYVNYYARRDFGGSTIMSCLGNYQEFYDEAGAGMSQSTVAPAPRR